MFYVRHNKHLKTKQAADEINTSLHNIKRKTPDTECFCMATWTTLANPVWHRKSRQIWSITTVYSVGLLYFLIPLAGVGFLKAEIRDETVWTKLPLHLFNWCFWSHANVALVPSTTHKGNVNMGSEAALCRVEKLLKERSRCWRVMEIGVSEQKGAENIIRVLKAAF